MVPDERSGYPLVLKVARKQKLPVPVPPTLRS